MFERAIKQAKTGAKVATDLSTDDVLHALGLRRQATGFAMVLPPLGFFAAGMLLGAGAGLLLAPRSGRETRRQLRTKAQSITRRVESAAQGVAHDVRGALTTPSSSTTKEAGTHRPATQP